MDLLRGRRAQRDGLLKGWLVALGFDQRRSMLSSERSENKHALHWLLLLFIRVTHPVLLCPALPFHVE
jgi:hypothetical protein